MAKSIGLPKLSKYSMNSIRLFGIETEYGIAREDCETADPVVESMELVRAYLDGHLLVAGIIGGNIPMKINGGFVWPSWHRIKRKTSLPSRMHIGHFPSVK